MKQQAHTTHIITSQKDTMYRGAPTNAPKKSASKHIISCVGELAYMSLKFNVYINALHNKSFYTNS